MLSQHKVKNRSDSPEVENGIERKPKSIINKLERA